MHFKIKKKKHTNECDGGCVAPAVGYGMGNAVPPQPDGTPGSGDMWGDPTKKKKK